jgi:hypothetical protein
VGVINDEGGHEGTGLGPKGFGDAGQPADVAEVDVGSDRQQRRERLESEGVLA